jgi:hypothetical protein
MCARWYLALIVCGVTPRLSDRGAGSELWSWYIDCHGRDCSTVPYGQNKRPSPVHVEQIVGKKNNGKE